MFLNISGELPGCSPPDCRISCRTCQHHLETRPENVRDRVESDQQNLATQTGQLRRHVCWHDY